MNTTLSSGYRKARKPHCCFGCGGPIYKGQTYSFWSGVWDGEIGTTKLCSTCDLIPQEYYVEDGIEPGALMQYWTECRPQVLTQLIYWGYFHKNWGDSEAYIRHYSYAKQEALEQ